MENDEFTKGERAYLEAAWMGLAPDPLMDIDEWADKHRILSSVSSSEPGPYRTSRIPFMREIYKCLSPSSPIEEVIVQKGAQLGFTETGCNWLGFIIDVTSGPVMAVQPTVDMAKRYSKQRVAQLIDTCDRLKDKVKEARSRDSGNTVLSKEFPGGILVMTGANSATGLRSLSARFLFMDEIDAYPDNLDEEGSPITLAKARTRNFARRKIYMVSTPTTVHRSKIEKEFLEGDQRYFFVPCPHCSFKQTLKWANIRYKDVGMENTYLKCEGCEKPIQEHYKTWMLENGVWIPQNKNAEAKKASFHLNSLYSPLGWFSWKDAASLFEESHKVPEKLRGFVNTVLGETWRESGDSPEWERLYERREDYKIGTVPFGGLFLVAGADVQKDRIECEIVSYGLGKESFSVDYRILMGDTSNPDGGAWLKLDELLAEQFPHETGVSMPIRLMAVDSGFNTQAVYNWCRKYPMSRVIATKGVENSPIMLNQPSTVDVTIKGGRKVARGMKVWPIGVNLAKSELYGWLRIQKPVDGEAYPACYCHFPQYGEEFFKQLCGEQLTIRVMRGNTKSIWEKIRDRNEALDCRILCRVAAAAVGMDRFKKEHWQNLASSVGLSLEKIINKTKVEPTFETNEPKKEPATPENPPQKAPTRRPNSWF